MLYFILFYFSQKRTFDAKIMICLMSLFLAQVERSVKAVHEKGFNFDDPRLLRGAWRNEHNPDACKVVCFVLCERMLYLFCLCCFFSFFFFFKGMSSHHTINVIDSMKLNLSFYPFILRFFLFSV